MNTLNNIEEITLLGYQNNDTEQLTRDWHNKHHDLNGLDCLKTLEKRIDIDVVKQYRKEIEDEKDVEFKQTLIKRFYNEIDRLYFNN